MICGSDCISFRPTGDGVVAASDHVVDPAWSHTRTVEHSYSRHEDLLWHAGERKGSIDAGKMM